MDKSIRSYEEVMNAALALPPNERVILAEQLMETLDPEAPERIEALWAEVAERRDKKIEDGIVKPIPAKK